MRTPLRRGGKAAYFVSSPEPALSGGPADGGVRPERLKKLAERVGPSLTALGRKPWFPAVLGIAALAGISAAGALWVLSAVVHSKTEVVVPDLASKNVFQAVEILSPLNLPVIKEGVEFNETSPAGAILRQNPPAGLKVREGKVVRVTLSSGGKVSLVPGVVGRPLAEAQNLLKGAGLIPGAVSQAYSLRFDVGWVVDQSPSSGTVVSHGQLVDLKSSKGPPPEGVLLMPDFIGRPRDEAETWAADKNVNFILSEESRSDVPAGAVLRQSPEPDGVLKEDSTVRIAVAKP